MTQPRPDDLTGSKNLSYKIIAGIMLAMGLLISLLIIVFAYSVNTLEHTLMEKHIFAELELVKKELSKDADYTLPQTATLQVYKPHTSQPFIPEYLDGLGIGFNDEVSANGATYFVLVGEVSGDPIYIVNDISEFEQSENTFWIIVIGSWCILMSLIFVVSYVLIRYLLKPISDFSDEVGKLQPQQRGLKLSDKYHGLEIQKITRSFDQYLNKLDEYVERQHAFAAMASHELRTPLTVVQTSAELIASRTQDERITSQCEKIIRSTSNMSDMILALLSITRDQTRDEEQHAVRIFDVVQEALTNFEHQIRINRLQIENWVQPDLTFRCNSALLSVVVNNLLSNAIKHSPEGLIRINYINHSLSILDNGEGLGTDDIDHLFKRGVAGKTSGGYGLGLYITRLICDKQGWKLDLQNANPGTEATVTFLRSSRSGLPV
jgi:signal transduction histidine kinase